MKTISKVLFGCALPLVILPTLDAVGNVVTGVSEMIAQKIEVLKANDAMAILESNAAIADLQASLQHDEASFNGDIEVKGFAGKEEV